MMTASDESHSVWSDLLVEMEERAASKEGGGVSTGLLAKVLKRVRIGAGATGRGALRAEIGKGTMLKRANASTLAPASVSKAASVLLAKKLLSEPEVPNGQK